MGQFAYNPYSNYYQQGNQAYWPNLNGQHQQNYQSRHSGYQSGEFVIKFIEILR